MSDKITYIYSKTVNSPSKKVDINNDPPKQNATGGGLQLINKDSESCELPIKIDVITTFIDTWVCPPPTGIDPTPTGVDPTPIPTPPPSYFIPSFFNSIP